MKTHLWRNGAPAEQRALKKGGAVKKKRQTGSGTGGGGGSLDAVLQPWADGAYNGGPFKVYGGAFPRPGARTLLIDATLPTPALGSTVSANEIIVAAIMGATVLAESLAGVPKHAEMSKPDGSGKLVQSIDVAGNNPDIVVGTMAWYAGETQNYTNTHVHAIDNPITQYIGVVSNGTPENGGAYQTVFHAADISGAPVRQIGIALTVTVVSTGGASATESTIYSNAEGVFETVHNTAGAAGSSEHTHVTDGTISSDAPTVTPIASNRELTPTVLDVGDVPPYGGSLKVSAVISAPAGSVIMVHSVGSTGLPTLGDTSGVPLSSQPFVFTNAADSGTGPVGANGVIHSSGPTPLAADFTGTVLIPCGYDLMYEIIKAVPNLPCSTIRPVAIVGGGGAKNMAAFTDNGTGDANVVLTFPQAISNAHNTLFAFFAANANGSFANRVGWTERTEHYNTGGGNPLSIECQHRIGVDTAASCIFGGNLRWAVAVEFEALP